ncbi:MAG: hypothetical protein MK135_12045, partial [Polyangiaceae bacterium]|nr:hypothetical protein [Polyangiaceae bacterium]
MSIFNSKLPLSLGTLGLVILIGACTLITQPDRSKIDNSPDGMAGADSGGSNSGDTGGTGGTG